MYFDEAATANNDAIMAKLGLEEYIDDPLLDIPVIKLTGAPQVVV